MSDLMPTDHLKPAIGDRGSRPVAWNQISPHPTPQPSCPERQAGLNRKVTRLKKKNNGGDDKW